MRIFRVLAVAVALILGVQQAFAQSASDCWNTYQTSLSLITANEATLIQAVNDQEAQVIATLDQAIIDVTQMYIDEYENCQTQQCRDSLWAAFQHAVNDFNEQKAAYHEICNNLRSLIHANADDARNQALKDYLDCLNCLPVGGGDE